jgi:DNA-binding NtrC family response regulator
MPHVGADRRIQTLLGNPFGDGWERACAALRHLDVASAASERLSSGDTEAAERVILGVGHARACSDPDDPAHALGERHLPRALERRLPQPRGAYLRVVMAAARCRRALLRLHGRSPAMQAVRRDTWGACFGESLYHALKLGRLIHDHDVLLLGETGTGKEAVAIAILEGEPGPADGSRAPRAMLNVAAVPDTLVESELFGHVRGSFTGATSDRRGRIRSAAGGCFFLDEVGDLPQTAQVKLLRVMENDLVAPIGSDVEHEANVRYVAATHKPLDVLAEQGSFRRDLYERMAGHVIRLPPLRERPEDVVDIGMAFVERELGSETLVDRSTIERWLAGPEAQRHDWFGNVRELENALRDLMLGLDPSITPAKPAVREAPTVPERVRKLRASLAETSDWYIARVLEETGGNHSRAARLLGIDRTTLRRRLSRRTAH